MFEAVKRRLTFANVVALIALFVALGGSVYGAGKINGKQIKKRSIAGKKLKMNTVTGKEVKESKLGTVPRATLADTLAAPEGFHEVGAPGEPGFQNSWRNRGGDTDETVAFYKDREGVVHLKGAAVGGTQSLIFQLPPGYRPANGKALNFAVACDNCSTSATDPQGGSVTVPTQTASVTIFGSGVGASSDGGVAVTPNVTLGIRLSVDGITFRGAS